MSINLDTTETNTDRETVHHARLTSAEVANLWSQYLNDSLAVCFIKHSLTRAQDPDVRSVLEFAQKLSLGHLEQVKQFFGQEGYDLPVGFTDEDIVNPNAPALFSDDFLLYYFYVMSLLGMTSYAGALSTSTRKDQREYFSQCNEETMQLFNKIVDLMVQKGLYVRPAVLHAPQAADTVEKQHYLAGWLGKERPLNAIEISSIFFNMVKIEVKIVLEMAFGQVAQSEAVRKYMQRGVKMCQSQFTELSRRLSEDDLPLPRKWESEITDSVIAPFSDKMMLFHIVMMISASAAFYGAGLSVSQRKDLAVQYMKLTTEVGLFAEDGVNLLIKNGWMEQPPGAIDRQKLMNPLR